MRRQPYLRSFTGGIIAPELHGRFDLLKYQTGLAEASNFQILPHGPARNRAGFEYIVETKDSSAPARLIPFIYSSTEAYLVELGNLYARFHTAGGTVLEAAQSVASMTTDDPALFTITAHGFLTGDWVYTLWAAEPLLNARYMKVVKITNDTYNLTDLHGAPLQGSDVGAYSTGMTHAKVYELTAYWTTAQLPDIHFSQNGNQLSIVHPDVGVRELTRLTASTFLLAPFAYNTGQITNAAAAVGGPGGGTALNYHYELTFVNPEDTVESPVTAGSVTGSVSRDLTVVGNYNEVSCDNPGGGVTVRVYRVLESDGAEVNLPGYVGSFVPETGSKFRDYNIAPDFTQQPPTNFALPATTGNFPGAITHFDRRVVQAGTDNNPLRLWLTNVNADGGNHLIIHTPTRDTDAIVVDITSTRADRILHLVPLDDLIAFTASAEFKVFGAAGQPLTSSSASARAQSYIGASNLQPVVSNTAILYVSARGNHPREMKFSWQQQAYEPTDIAVMAPHLFNQYSSIALALQRGATPTLWIVRSDGKLLGMTYQPEHDVRAWHLHESTNGEFESIAIIPEEGVDFEAQDSLYAIVKRTINGQTKRYIERLRNREFTGNTAAFFVDSGLSYSGLPVTTVPALWHLEGETVSILSDGAVQPQAVVTGGSVSFNDAGAVVHVGLPINAYLNTLPIRDEAMAASAGTYYAIGDVFIRVDRSGVFKVGPRQAAVREVPLRTNEAYGTPPGGTNLVTSEVQVGVGSDWSTGVGIWVVQTDPLPLTVLSLGVVLETA